MTSGKEGNELALALELPEQQRSETIDLNVGYIEPVKSWELIAKYTGSLDRVRDELHVQVTELLNYYAVIVVREDLIDQLLSYPEIIFLEKPKGLFYEVTEAAAASCIYPVQNPPYRLSGRGVLVAIIDSGIDYAHPDFRNADGTTRILYLWDQTGFVTEQGDGTQEQISAWGGIVYNEADINQALAENDRALQQQIVREVDVLGHGTHVAGIACGNGRASDGRILGVAPESSLLVVKLANSLNNSFPKTTQMMTAVDFAIRTAVTLKMPLVINLSLGNTAGSHDGNTLLEQYLNDAAGVWQISIVTGAGNEGAEQGHAGGILKNYPVVVEMNIGEGETSMNVQIWKNYYDDFTIELISPSGRSTGVLQSSQASQEFQLGMTRVVVLYSEPKPMNMKQEVYFLFLPGGNVLESGNWKFILTPIRIVTGEYNFWLPTSGILAQDTRFLEPDVNRTLTIPATARELITVGAYDSNTDSYAFFSGRGNAGSTVNFYVKPDLAAPGVGIEAASPGGSYTMRSGTSMAAPFVTGSAALLMEWGIVQGNDAYLYGDKLKTYLLRGARQLPGFDFFPNPQVGYGALCLYDSMPDR